MTRAAVVPSLLALLLSALACTSSAGSPAAGPPPQSDAAAAQPSTTVRGGDAAARGLGPADFPKVQQLAPGVYVYSTLRSPDLGATTNNLIVVTSAGVLVADGQANAAETKKLVDAVARLTDRPITHVVVASDHGDHTGGNSAFPAGATFFAHPTSAAVLRASASSANRPAGAPPVRVPTELVPDRKVLTLGGREIQILHLGRAHTGGDLAVWLPAEKVLFLSETFSNHIFPSMRTAAPSEWLAAIDRARGMDVDLYLPGHGFVDPPRVLEEELVAYQDALKAVIAEATRLHHAGATLEQAVAQARFGAYESWVGRNVQAERAIGRVYLELNGGLPPK